MCELRVLAVDDNIDMIKSVAGLLSAWKYDFRSATSGAEALTIAQTYDPHAVLLDIMMPGMDGYAVALRLRETLPDITIIGLTALHEDQYRFRGWDTGFNFYLVKPLDPDVLRAMLLDIHRTLEVKEKAVRSRARSAGITALLAKKEKAVDQ